MMPGVGFEEMILLVLVAIVVIGPKDLPLMMRKFGRFTGKMRAMAFEFKQGIDELGRQAELDELRKEVAALKSSTGLEDLKRDFEQDRIDLEKDVNSAMADPAPPTAPAIAGATHPAAAKPLPYAGLSADHPGYDAGEDFRIDGAAPAPTQPPASTQDVAPESNAAADGNDQYDGVHVVPDDEVRPAPAAVAPVKQDASA
jgi:sec-independent protein translocase protein TatB